MTFWAAKSMPPRISPTTGMMMSLTRELTTVPSAPPMMTPIASARALVFSRNARNSPSTTPSFGRGLMRADDTLRDPPTTAVPRPERPDGPGFPRRDDRGLPPHRAGPRDRQSDAWRRARQRRSDPDRTLDDESPRADRGRDGNGQDEDAPASGGRAVTGRCPGLRRRHQRRRNRD